MHSLAYTEKVLQVIDKSCLNTRTENVSTVRVAMKTYKVCKFAVVIMVVTFLRNFLHIIINLVVHKDISRADKGR